METEPKFAVNDKVRHRCPVEGASYSADGYLATVVAVTKASRGKSKRVQKTAQRHVYDIRYDCVQTNGTDVSYGVQEGELERRDVKIDPALMPPRPEDKQAWLREQFANYVGHDRVRKQIETQMTMMDFLHHCHPFLSLNDDNHDKDQSKMHAVFQGPPGTGKTDLARIWGKAAYVCGVTQTNLFVEVQGRDLVDKYANGTAAKARSEIEKARGGTLFVDEIQRLLPQHEKDESGEAIDELMRFMDMPLSGDSPLIIVAGYDEGDKTVAQFISYNKGMDRRLPV
eukprot:COSAG03_NODE_5213_length_1311_cov_6.147690_1_plen_283_part_10